MRRKSILPLRESYTPNLFLDTLMEMLNAKSDAALARMLEAPPSTISKVRHKWVAVNSELLLAAHELTGMSIRELRDLMGDTRAGYWMADVDSSRTATRASSPRPSFMEQRQREATRPHV